MKARGPLADGEDPGFGDAAAGYAEYAYRAVRLAAAVSGRARVEDPEPAVARGDIQGYV